MSSRWRQKGHLQAFVTWTYLYLKVSLKRDIAGGHLLLFHSSGA